MIKPFLFHLPAESCCVSNNGRRARLGSGGPCRLPSHMRTEGCPHRATIMGQEDQLSQPPSPTQTLRLWLYQERTGWEEAERRSDSVKNPAWPLAGRCGLAPRCTPQGTHSFRSLGNWASTWLEALQPNCG